MKMMIINKDYSLLWCGQLASQLGNRIYLMALAWYFVAVLGNGSGLFMLFMVSALTREFYKHYQANNQE